MTLSDDQIKQIFKYVHGEMNAPQQQAFEKLLLENERLRDEVELYKEIGLLSKTLAEKNFNVDLPSELQRSKSNNLIWTMLAEARKKWESEFEAAARLQTDNYANEDKAFPASAQKNKTTIMNFSKWLAVAAVAGIVCLSVALWYLTNPKRKTQVVVDNSVGDSVTISSKKTDGGSTGLENTPEAVIPDGKTNAKNLSKNQREKMTSVFEDYFTPDLAPVSKEGPLENAFASYENKEYQQAIREFERADLGPLTRGPEEENRKLNAFYIPYYKGLSYLASNKNTTMAIDELKKAITQSPDQRWTGKAKWYLALAHLKLGESEKTQSLLKEVIRNNKTNELQQKAIELSKALDQE